jgi:hypothetical protein
MGGILPGRVLRENTYSEAPASGIWSFHSRRLGKALVLQALAPQ